MTGQRGELNELLRKWSESHASSPSDQERLRVRVAAALRGQETRPRDGSLCPHTSSPASGPLSSKTAWLVFAAAASVLIAVALWSWSSVQRNTGEFASGPAPAGSSRPDTPPPDVARLAKSQLREKRTLLEESQRLFAGRVGWIAETGDRVQIDVVPDGGPAVPTGQWLAVRLVVTRHNSDGTECPVWSLDLISSSQQVVQLAGDSPDGADVTLWNYTLPDGMIAVDARLDVPDADPAVRLQASYTGLQESGVPNALHSWTAGGAEYEVYQTVTAMEGHVL
jgi:hypothetical protein